MPINPLCFAGVSLKRVCNRSAVLLLGVCGGLSGEVCAEDWQIDPEISLTEHYSDNINLSPTSGRNSAFVTDISPGLSVRGLGARYNLQLDYRMQNLLYEGGGKVDRTNQQFQTTSNSELIRNALFLDIRSTHGQQNSSSNAGNLSSDNISGSSNRTDVTTFSISPYWTPYLGGYVDGEVRFTYETFSSDESNASDSNTHNESIYLRNGTRSNKVTWYFDFENDYSHRDDGDNVQFRHYEGELRFNFNRDYSLFVRAGRYDNQYSSNTSSNSNGTFKAIGFGWNPSRKLYVEGLTGDEITEVSLRYEPSSRTYLSVTFTDRDVGTNVGETWNLEFNHETRRTNWSFRFSEDTTTTQQTFTDADIFRSVFGDGVNIVDDSGNLITDYDIDLPTLQDEVYRRRRGDLSLTGRVSSKTRYSLSAYREKRTYQVSEQDQEVTGLRGNLSWRFMRRTTANLRGSWQETDQESQDQTDKRYELAIGLQRQLGDTYGVMDQFLGNIELRHLKQTSDDNSSEYEENRISATIRAIF